MNIFRLIAELFLIYILYKVIFKFIIPLYQSTKKIKKQFGEMQNKMQQEMNAYQNQNNPGSPQPKTKVNSEDDYIEFEEVRK